VGLADQAKRFKKKKKSKFFNMHRALIKWKHVFYDTAPLDNQSHFPSGGPSNHRSKTFEQSNFGFPSFSFTSL
jgi:hypothetical protein